MKTIALIILTALPFFCSAQCPDYFTGDTAFAQQLVKITERYMQTNLRFKAKPIKSSYSLFYKDSAGTTTISIGLKREKIKTDSTVSYSAPVVSAIYITGPAVNIDRMVKEYFTPMLLPCTKSSAPLYIIFSNARLVSTDVDDDNGRKIKFIRIEKTL
jgi:hypothetical protein